MLDLDKKTRQLLYLLDIDSSQSLSQLAKKIKLSKTATKYRIDQLTKQGIIIGHHAIIDTGKVGFYPFRLYLKLQNASPQKETDFISYLCNHKSSTWVVSVEGSWDIACLFLVKDIQQMNTIWFDILEKFVNIIERRLLVIMSSVTFFSHSYLTSTSNTFAKCIISTPSSTNISEIDKKLIQLLSLDGRKPIIELAQLLKVSVPTVIVHKRALEKLGIIAGYRTIFSLSKLGLSYHKIHLQLNNVKKDQVSSIHEFLKIHPHIIYDDFVLGGDDIEFESVVESREQLSELIADLRAKFHSIIKNYEILEYTQEHKYIALPSDL